MTSRETWEEPQPWGIGRVPDGGGQGVYKGPARTAVIQMGLKGRPFGWGEVLRQEVRRKILDFVAVDFSPVK